ncbi:MAG: alpha/beta fold hydrolase [Myxococcales bacterium]
MRLPLSRGLLFLSGLWACAGCAGLFHAPDPMRSLSYRWQGGKARCLVVLLPGMGDSDMQFERKGFIAEMRRRPLSVDLVAADATFGYYAKGVMVDRLSEDVLEPLRSRGYEQVWAIGVSMGGMGSFLYSNKRPAQLDGILALAPYLGGDAVAREIRSSGGLSKWKAPPKEQMSDANYRRQLWRYLQAITTGAEKGPDLYVGWGTDDGLGAEVSLLASALPPKHVWTTKGGHDWATWRTLLEQFLDNSDFARACSAAPRSDTASASPH